MSLNTEIYFEQVGNLDFLANLGGDFKVERLSEVDIMINFGASHTVNNLYQYKYEALFDKRRAEHERLVMIMILLMDCSGVGKIWYQSDVDTWAIEEAAQRSGKCSPEVFTQEEYCRINDLYRSKGWI